LKVRDTFDAARAAFFENRHQYYFLDIAGAPSSAIADVYEFDGHEAIGEITRYTVRWTHASPDLPAKEYIGKRGAFLIQPPTGKWQTPEAPRRRYGVVTAFAKLGSSPEESFYEVVLESRLALLRNVRRVRFFQNMSEPDVIVQILKEHGFNQIWARVEMQLYRTYREHAIITQWHEDDFAFLQRLCRRTGIWFVIEEGERCEVVRFGDDLTHYRRDASRDNHPFQIAFQAESGMHTTGVESVKTLEMHARSIPTSYHVRSYNYKQAPHPIETTETFHPETGDETTYGEQYVFGLSIQTKADAERQALLRQEAALSAQIEYRGSADALDVAAGRVYAFTNRTLPDAPYGLLIVGTQCSASRKQGFKVEFTAISCDRLYRMPLLEDSWPRISGTVTATIASTPEYSGPYIDRHGEYVAKFHFDRDSRTPGMESCLLRLAKPYAGKWQSGFHFGLYPGSLVAVAFFMGDPDQPYILHALHNSQHPDPVVSDHKWRTRGVMRTPQDNTLQMEDRIGYEHIRLATPQGKSQLNLGHAVSRDDERRGLGFELRSDERGVARAGGGLLLTAEKQAGARGEMTDMAGAKQVFQLTQEQADSLMQAASVAKAEVADLKAERQWMKDELADLKRQVIALSAPAGIGMATPGPVSVAAGKDVSTTTLAGFNVSAMKNVAVAAKEALSLFAYRMGVKIKAAQGPVVVEAQSDVMSLAAQKDVTVSSVDGSVRVRAKQDITVECGGAFIEIKDGNMTLGGPGKLIFKFAGMKKDSAQMAHLSAPAFATAAVPFKTSCEAWLNGNTTVEKVTPPVPVVDWKRFDALPAAPDAARADTETPSSDAPDADHDSKHEPKLPTTSKDQIPEPIKLEKQVWCDWKLKKLSREVSTETETGQYKATDYNRRILLKRNGALIFAGAVMPANFRLDYDPDSKTVVATVRIKIKPVDLLKADPFGTPIVLNGETQSVPYHHDHHWSVVSQGVNQKTSAGLVMQYRDSVGNDFNLAAQKSRVESVLNSHRSLLILDGCSRAAACGCRVSVKFNVEFVLSVKDARVGECHKEVWLFPRSGRADAACWGEINGIVGDDGSFTPSAVGNVVAHECGHLFNYPDEYWKDGGWVHKNYISPNQELDFARGDANAGKKVWQIESQTNLMGYGAVSTNATVDPNYLEYVRKEFSELSNKKWKIGYDA
jgi:type VI secretion system secreted protein VgrG